MAFVLDASVTCAWFFGDERTPEIAALSERTNTECAYVPSLWLVEVANVLIQASRRGRLPQADVGLALATLQRMNIKPSPHQPDITTVVALSLKHDLTAYDALYLAHAVGLLLPLATLDEPLRQAAAAEGLTVWPLG